MEFDRKKRPPKSSKSQRDTGTAARPGSAARVGSAASVGSTAPGGSAVPAASTTPKPAPLPNRVAERILSTADDLFYREGVRAVGIQRVIEEAGIAKASLYAHYASKDDLVAACVDRRAHATRAAVEAVLAATPDDPRAKLLALFDFQRQAVADPGFHGCPVQKTHTELFEDDHPAKRVTAAHRQWVLDLFGRLVREAGLTSPDYVAGTLIVLFDGAIATTMVDRDPNATRYARWAAEQIIDAHLPPR